MRSSVSRVHMDDIVDAGTVGIAVVLATFYAGGWAI
ncbi:hypothetical protein LMG9673_03084 [Ralstonia pseudosolanacearum]|nr:hypothetical protein LMG9673_03084 [Ralstonia pseudosolanacearum]